MKNRGHIKPICWSVAILIAICLLAPFRAFAIEKVDINRKVTLTVHHRTETAPIANVTMQLYRVAAMTTDAEFRIESGFEEAGVSLGTDSTEESWTARAITMESYLIVRAADGNPAPVAAAATTDKDGIAVFPDLEVGLYLLVGKSKTVGTETNAVLASFISLPILGEDESWDYAPSVYTKNSSHPRIDTHIDLSVIKVWKDSANETRRPAEVTITLYGDGIKHSVVKLSKANNWRYSWHDLHSDVSWRAVENNVPENYTVTAVREQNVFIVTNTYKEPSSGGSSPQKPPKPTPPPPDNPTPPEPDNPKPSNPDVTISPEPNLPEPPPEGDTAPPTPDSSSTPLLPQTGQLWWPIPLLYICGLLFLLIGLKLRKRVLEVRRLKISLYVGKPLAIVGGVLVSMAVGLIAFNLYENHAAQQFGESVVRQLTFNYQEAWNIQGGGEENAENEAANIPLYVTNPEIEMPTIELDGQVYIGRMDIPTLNLSLPVMSDWSYPQLKLSPCRYLGSAYQDDLIIVAHNYKSHFGGLKYLGYGDSVEFVDVDGNVFQYVVADIEQLKPTDVDKLTDGDWALTLMTCTLGGEYRIAVRCVNA